MNLQEELKALKERIAELEEQVKGEREFPRIDDEYWIVESTGEIDNGTWEGNDIDNEFLAVGNVFKTWGQAEFAAEKLKVEAELRKFSRPVFKEDEDNYFIELVLLDKTLAIDSSDYFQIQGTIYFETAYEASLAIDTVGEQRIKKYIFEVED